MTDTRLVGRVAEIEAGQDRQRITLSDGRSVEARLIVLATGMGGGLRRQLGIERRTLFEKHSLTFGFGIVPAPGGASA